MIRIGTSGFSYDDWRGSFYPPGTSKTRMFEAYCECFNAVEVNAPFYGIPSAKAMQSLVRRAAGRVSFAVKMSMRVTHEGDLSSTMVLQYQRAIAPMVEAGVFGAVLFQFPFRFHATTENRAYLTRALETFKELPSVVEIRHDSWQTETGMQFFHDQNISLSVLDMPCVSRLPRTRLELTGPIAYVRFHGRNGRHWFKDSYPGAPYDYDYSEEELSQWVKPIRSMERKAQTASVFFNNHVRAQAPKNAETLKALLGEGGFRRQSNDLFGGSWI